MTRKQLLMKKKEIWEISQMPGYLGNFPDTQAFGKFPKFPEFLQEFEGGICAGEFDIQA